MLFSKFRAMIADTVRALPLSVLDEPRIRTPRFEPPASRELERAERYRAEIGAPKEPSGMSRKSDSVPPLDASVIRCETASGIRRLTPCDSPGRGAAGVPVQEGSIRMEEG